MGFSSIFTKYGEYRNKTSHPTMHRRVSMCTHSSDLKVSISSSEKKKKNGRRKKTFPKHTQYCFLYSTVYGKYYKQIAYIFELEHGHDVFRWSWKNASVVKSTDCSSRGPSWIHSNHMVVTNHLYSSSRGILCSLVSCPGIA